MTVETVVLTNVDTDYVILNAQAATGDITELLDVTLTGLTWGNCQEDDDDACTLTFSMVQD
ncbi:hypothetical protein KAU08_11485 [bacterium]|nr:hypothetical protein [bacterium]